MKTNPQFVLSRPWWQGRSLVELALALVVLGVLSVAAVGFWQAAQRHRVVAQTQDGLLAAKQAVLAFAHARFRLPCPDVNADGVEDCSDGATLTRVGAFPWKTVGLGVPRAGLWRYGVDRMSDADAAQDRDLGTIRDRAKVLVSAGATPTAIDSLLGAANLIDLCSALHRAVDAPVVGSSLVAAEGTGTSAVLQSMAYVLVDPGMVAAQGATFDGLNRLASHASPRFESPGRPSSPEYDDRVLAVRPDELMTDLQCPKALSAVNHTHANAALSAALIRRALDDLRYQLQVKAVMAGGGVASAIAGQLMSIAGLANAVAALANATTFTVITVGSAGGLIAAAIASVIANTAATVTAVGTLAASIAITVEAGLRVTRGNELADQAATVATVIDARMRTADLRGY